MRVAFVTALVAFGWSFYNLNQIGRVDNLNSATKSDPVQTAIAKMDPIIFKTAAYTYTASPSYDYTITGIVVSKQDYEPQETDVTLPMRYDICMVWGKNATSGIYLSPDVSFSQNQRFCNFNYSGSLDFNKAELSNNHIVTTDQAILDKIKMIRRGDEISITGYLINMNAMPNSSAVYDSTKVTKWDTSITRTDTGAGACEVIYVKSLDILTDSHVLDKQQNQYSLWGLIGTSSMFIIELFIIMLFVKPKARTASGFIKD